MQKLGNGVDGPLAFASSITSWSPLSPDVYERCRFCFKTSLNTSFFIANIWHGGEFEEAGNVEKMKFDPKRE